MTRILKFWGPVAGWCLIIYAFSDIPDLSTGWGVWDFVFRKTAHAVEFGVLAGLFWRALEGGKGAYSPEFFWLTLLFSMLYAASDEWHQSFVPGRVGCARDVALDSLGAGAVCLLQMKWRRSLFSRMEAGRWFGLLPLVAVFFLTGCERLSLVLAEHREKSGQYEAALKAYVRLADRHPSSSTARKALYDAGNISANVLGDYPLARGFYQRLIEKFGDQKGWGERAERAMFNTPNYFPLVADGLWEEGDADTGGKNALIKTACRSVDKDPTAALFVRSYYAGGRFVKDLSLASRFRKKDLELWEYPGEKELHVVVLRFPFDRGNRWEIVRGNRKFWLEIAGTTAVKVRAGEFKDCLTVTERQEGISSSWKVTYYAPGVGRVLTSLATSAGERRNTELISYNLGAGSEIGN